MSAATELIWGIEWSVEEPIGLPRDFLHTHVGNEEHIRLFAAPGVRELVEADPLPIPTPKMREGYYDDRHLEYWLSGLNDFRKILAAVGDRLRDGMTYYDFGGSTGRVARHAINHPAFTKVLLSDANRHTVGWAAKHFSKKLVPFVNTLAPVLPLRDATVDVLSAFSVFTHIDELEIPWLMELARVTKPDGLLYVTIVDEYTWALFEKNPWLVKSYSKSPAFHEFWPNPTLPAPRLPIHYNHEKVYNCDIFLSTDYVRSTWGRLFRSIDFLPQHHNYQTVVLLRDPVL